MCAPNSQPACMITQTQARERKKAYLFRSCWWIASDGNVSNLCSYWFPDLDSVWEFPRFDKAWWLVTLPEWLWSGRGSLLKYDLHVVRFLIFSHLFVAVIWVRWASRPFFLAQICCAQQSSTHVRGSALVQWVPNPLVTRENQLLHGPPKASTS